MMFRKLIPQICTMHMRHAICIEWWRCQTCFCLLTLIYQTSPSSDLHRQIFKITSTKNMCKRAPGTSRYVYFTTFPFFFTLSAFKNQHHGNKRNPQLPYYWILKQCAQETPLRVSFKRVKKEDALHVPHRHRNSGERRYQTELLRWWLCSQAEVGERWELAWQAQQLAGRGGGWQSVKAGKTAGTRRVSHVLLT